jgi:hypothetical protein
VKNHWKTWAGSFAFLTFSQKQWNRHVRGVKEFGRPPFNLDVAKFSEPLALAATPQLRALHAQCVKIPREARDGEIFLPVSLGFFWKNQLASVVLKTFLNPY